MGLQVGVTRPDAVPARLGEPHKRLKALKYYWPFTSITSDWKVIARFIKEQLL